MIIIVSLLFVGNGVTAHAAVKSKVAWNTSKKTLTVGEKFKLKLKKKNVKSAKLTKVKTSNKKVAKVSKKGVVTALKKGKTTITGIVKITYRGTKKTTNKRVVCKVNVKAKKSSSERPAATNIATETNQSTQSNPSAEPKPNPIESEMPEIQVTLPPSETIPPDTKDVYENFGDQWKFSKIEKEEDFYLTEEFDDADWEDVNLPHTWNSKDGCDGWDNIDSNGNSYYRGLGIYRKSFELSDLKSQNKEVFLDFEGVNTIAKVYVNHQYVGIHEGGYSGFRFDITDYVNWTNKNIVAVVVDNSPTTYIAPLAGEGDFTKFGGMYRGVSLLAMEQTHVDVLDAGSQGVKISSSLSDDFSNADVSVHTLVQNDTEQDKEVVVYNYIFDKDGNTVLQLGKTVNVPAGKQVETANVGRVLQPHLWNGVNDPYMYSVKTMLYVDGAFEHVISTAIAFRDCQIRDNQFFLNGKSYEIHGVNYHEDSFENGSAMTEEMFERDYKEMIEMGVTAVRMAHYQHSQMEYDLCDQLGLLVWSEIPLINRTKEETITVDSELFSENIKHQLEEMIKQNRNHPCIFTWGISNELYDVDEETCQLYQELCTQAKTLDASRPTIYADNVGTTSTDKRSMPTDLVGYNRYDGWYYNNFSDMGRWIAKRMNLLQKQTCISEYGAGGAVSQHMDNPTKDDISPNGANHCEEYQSLYHEKVWANIAKHNQTWGEFIWCMYDFASDVREEGDTKGQNDKGLVTRDRKTRKDAFYFYQSVWSEKHMVHITSSRYSERPSTIPKLKVYSNAESVELFVNDVSIGAVEKSSLGVYEKTVFQWSDVNITAGKENVVRAVAKFSDGSTETDEIMWQGK